MSAFMGTPRARLAKATPNSKAEIRLPANIDRSHNRRQEGFISLLRNSKAIPRMIKASNKINSGR